MQLRDAAELHSAKIVYVRFKKFPAGHLFLIFRFADGQEMVMSPQGRTAPDEDFSLFRGLFKSYPLFYVFQEPESFMEKYRQRGRKVEASPLSLTRDELVHLYQHLHTRAVELQQKTEWYHTLFNSCVTEIVHALDDIRGRRRFLPVFLLMVNPKSLFRL